MDETDHEQERRRVVLRAWIKANGGHAAVVEKRRLTPSQASYLSQVVNGYSFASRAARNMEERLGMPAKHLDAPSTTTPAAPAVTEPVAPQPPTLADALPVVLDALAGVAPKRRQELLDTLSMCVHYGRDNDRKRLAEMLAATSPAVDQDLLDEKAA